MDGGGGVEAASGGIDFVVIRTTFTRLRTLALYIVSTMWGRRQNDEAGELRAGDLKGSRRATPARHARVQKARSGASGARLSR